jgi:hypothetical protein
LTGSVIFGLTLWLVPCVGSTRVAPSGAAPSTLRSPDSVGSVRTLLAVTFALAAAATYAVAAVLQQRSAHAAPREDALRLRLLLRLARQPWWVFATLLEVASFGFQATALFFGPLVLVAPIFALDLLFALPLIARSRRMRLTLRHWASAAAVAGGIATFLAVASPSAGANERPFAAWVPLLAVVCALLAIAALALRHSSDRLRAMTLGAVGAVEFGVVVALSKSVVHQLDDDGWRVFLHWELYGLAVFGILGTLLAQSAYQAGSLAASLPIIDTVEPISGVVIGATLFSEKLASSAALFTVQLLAAALAIVGIIAIDRSTLVRDKAV